MLCQNTTKVITLLAITFRHTCIYSLFGNYMSNVIVAEREIFDFEGYKFVNEVSLYMYLHCYACLLF